MNLPQPREVAPNGDPVGGGVRRKVKGALLFSNAASGLNTSAMPLMFDVTIPSTRISIGVAVTFDPDNSDDAAFPTSGSTAWNVQLDAWVNLDNQRFGRLTRANQIMAPTPIPTMWEVESTTVKKWRGTVTIPNPAGVAAGRLWATAYWEPAPGESKMPDAELQQLFAACDIVPLIGGTGSVTGGGG